METAYSTVLTLTQDNLVKAVRCPIIVGAGKIDFRIPEQNDPFLIFQHNEYLYTDLGRIHCNAWFDSIGLGEFDMMSHFIKNLTPVEFLMKDSSGVSSIAGNLKHDPSLFRNAYEDFVVYSDLYDDAPEPSNYEIQVRNSSSGEWVTELGVRSGDNLKFRIVNIENPSQPISQVFEFSYTTNPFPAHFEDLQDDGFEIVLDNYASFFVVGVYNKDADFSAGIYLVPLPT